MLNIDVSHQPGPNLYVENERSAPGDVTRASSERILRLRREYGKLRDLFPGDNRAIVACGRSRLCGAAASKDHHGGENADAGHRPNEKKLSHCELRGAFMSMKIWAHGRFAVGSIAG